MLTDLTLPSPRFLVVVVLLVLSINVMWFHDSPVTPLGPISPVTPPGPISPVTPPGPISVTPLGPISPVSPPGPDSHVPPPPGPISPVTPLGPISPVTPPGPISPVTPPGPDSHVPPPPGPPPHVPPPGPDPYIIISWLIHFLSSKYLSIFSLLLLAIVALLWPSISTSIDSLRKAAIERCRGIENPIRPLCRNFINYLKALVTPKPKPKRTPEPKPNLNLKTGKDPTPLTDPIPVTDPTQEHDDDEDKDKDKDEDKPQDQGPTPSTIPTVREIVAVFRRHIVDPLRNLDILKKNPGPGPGPIPPTPATPPHIHIRKIVEDWGTHIVDRLRNLDILKSIIYGGLIESITSLGVVSSAAASGASTLNVLALGVTSLFSGGILIFHSLLGLKTKHLEAEERAKNNPSTNVEGEETPYQEQLGNYRNVILHRVVVMTSFVVFGMIPPLCYGLFFRKTDKGHYKAAVVLAVSLVCVILLSSAKVYAFKLKNKFRTVAEYTGMAFGASALSFITSQIFSEMLDKYGFHELAKEYRRE